MVARSRFLAAPAARAQVVAPEELVEPAAQAAVLRVVARHRSILAVEARAELVAQVELAAALQVEARA